MKNQVFEVIERHFWPSFEMLEDLIEICPDSIWLDFSTGFPFWQQIYHALESVQFWMRPDNRQYEMERFGKNVSHELGTACPDQLTREDIKRYTVGIREQAALFFLMTPEKILEQHPDYDRYTYLDAVLVQIRH